MRDVRRHLVHFDGETPTRIGAVAALVYHLYAHGVHAVSQIARRSETGERSTFERRRSGDPLERALNTRIEMLRIPDMSSVAETVTRGLDVRMMPCGDESPMVGGTSSTSMVNAQSASVVLPALSVTFTPTV